MVYCFIQKYYLYTMTWSPALVPCMSLELSVNLSPVFVFQDFWKDTDVWLLPPSWLCVSAMPPSQ